MTKKTKIFSFRASAEEVDRWQLYTQIRDIKRDEIGTEAMRAYIASHPLEGAEKLLYDERLQKLEKQL